MPNKGNGTEFSFRTAAMMARKALTPQAIHVQIPRLGMSEASFCRMDPSRRFRQQAILSTRFSSPPISGMIAGRKQ
jgi:hypothetical protein